MNQHLSISMKHNWSTPLRLVLSLTAIVVSAVVGFAFVSNTLSSTKAASSLHEVALPGNDPWGVTTDAKGNIWVAEPGCDPSPFVCGSVHTGSIALLKSSPFSVVADFTEPSGKGFSSPFFLVPDAKGNIWFAMSNTNAIGELTPNLKNPATSTWNIWTVPSAKAGPFKLAFDAHGIIWFTEPLVNKIGSFNPTTHAFTETTIPSAKSNPYGITGPDANGAMWFTENNSSVARVASFVPPTKGALTTATISEYLAVSPSSGTTLHLITLDKKGRAWWTEGFDGRIGSLTISQAVKGTSKGVTEYSTPACGKNGSHVSGIAVDNSGVVWYDDSLGNCVGSYNPATNKFAQSIQLSSNSHPHDGVAVGSDNSVYIVEEFGKKIGQIPQANPTTKTK